MEKFAKHLNFKVSLNPKKEKEKEENSNLKEEGKIKTRSTNNANL